MPQDNNHPSLARAKAPEKAHVRVGEKVKAREITNKLSLKHVKALEENVQLQPCCRNAMDHDVEFFKTEESAPGPDKMVLTCGCGRRHIRIAMGGKSPVTL